MCGRQNDALAEREAAFLAKPLKPIVNTVVVLCSNRLLILAKPASQTDSVDRNRAQPLHAIRLDVDVVAYGVLLKQSSAKEKRIELILAHSKPVGNKLSARLKSSFA